MVFVSLGKTLCKNDLRTSCLWVFIFKFTAEAGLGKEVKCISRKNQETASFLIKSGKIYY